MSGIDRIAAERARQITDEGWTAEHDNEHDAGELALAAIAYAARDPVQIKRNNRVVLEDRRADVVIYCDVWPWSDEFDGRGKHSRLHELAIAGALIAAEIDRIERQLVEVTT